MSTESNREPEAEQHRRFGLATVLIGVLVVGLALMVVVYVVVS